MAVSTVIHKSSLQRGLNPCHLGQVNIAGKLTLIYSFKVKFFNFGSIHHHDAGFFRVGGID